MLVVYSPTEPVNCFSGTKLGSDDSLNARQGPYSVFDKSGGALQALLKQFLEAGFFFGNKSSNHAEAVSSTVLSEKSPSTCSETDSAELSVAQVTAVAKDAEEITGLGNQWTIGDCKAFLKVSEATRRAVAGQEKNGKSYLFTPAYLAGSWFSKLDTGEREQVQELWKKHEDLASQLENVFKEICEPYQNTAGHDGKLVEFTPTQWEAIPAGHKFEKTKRDLIPLLEKAGCGSKFSFPTKLCLDLFKGALPLVSLAIGLPIGKLLGSAVLFTVVGFPITVPVIAGAVVGVALALGLAFAENIFGVWTKHIEALKEYFSSYKDFESKIVMEAVKDVGQQVKALGTQLTDYNSKVTSLENQVNRVQASLRIDREQRAKDLEQLRAFMVGLASEGIDPKVILKVADETVFSAQKA